MKRGLKIAFLLLTFSQYAIAQVTTADIREQIAKGECDIAESFYNEFKAMNGPNKTIEREIAECKSRGISLGVTLTQIREQIAKGECDMAQSLYNVYKAINGSNKTIENEIADCRAGSSISFGGTGSANGHEYVDLGLPSGTLWATCNVGASKPEDYGSYFAWGETNTKSTYNWGTYKYYNGGLTKYCSRFHLGYNGFTDNLTTLQSSDDPATVNWGSGWHVPSKIQWDELLNNTTNQWSMRNGVKGRLFTSNKNGQTIFLPAAASCWNSDIHNVGSYAHYWSSSLDTEDPSVAWNLLIRSDHCDMGATVARSSGFAVRPVREK